MTTIQEYNYFELLGLPVSFDIDPGQLSDNYRKIQKTIHPDKFSNASDLERRLSVQKAAQINDAFQTLKIPLKRAIYLLSLIGAELQENGTGLDPGFLMQQMELREKLASVSTKAQPLEELDSISRDVTSRLNSITQQLSENFHLLFAGESDNCIPDETKQVDDSLNVDHRVTGEKIDINQLRALVLKMQFLNRLQEECINMEEELLDQL